MRRMRAPLAVLAVVAVALLGISAAAPADSSRAANKDIVQTAAAAGNFKTLASLLKQAGLVKTLKGNGTDTVFAHMDSLLVMVS